MEITVRQLAGSIHNLAIRDSIKVNATAYFSSRDNRKIVKSFALSILRPSLQITTYSQHELDHMDLMLNDILTTEDLLNCVTKVSKSRLHIKPHSCIDNDTNLVKYIDFNDNMSRWDIITYSKDELDTFAKIHETKSITNRRRYHD